MESHNNVLKLLFISLIFCLVIFTTNAARSPISPPMPSPTSSSDESHITFANFFPLPHEQGQEEQPDSHLFSASQQQAGLLDGKIDLPSLQQDPEVKKICDSTDYPTLCLTAVLPNLQGKITVDTVLQAAVKASNMFAKHCQAVAQEILDKPGNPPKLKSAVKDCNDGLETMVENFEETLGAFSSHDMGTVRSMLSAVLTFAGDCEDQLSEVKEVQTPLLDSEQKLTNMTSNCLAIVSIITGI